MDQVITFDKSLQQRLQEYKDVLAGYEVLPAASIAREWSFYLDLTLDPDGWQAVWKIQRKTCEYLGIPFPSVVLVYVLSVDTKDLTAFVKVLAVEDDNVSIPDRHHVPLIHLWPTKEQDKSVVLNLHSTANVIDMLRFFYHNLIRPWDFEEDDSTDWKSKHLEPRLRLYYDMKNGVIPRIAGENIQSLLAEAKRIDSKREILESELETIDCFNEEAVDTNSKVQELVELHIRLMELKGELDILENPLFKRVIIKKHQDMLSNLSGDKKQHVWVIISHITADDGIKFFQKIKEIYPSEELTMSSQLSSALDSANANDIIILKEGIHEIKTTGALEHGGMCRGVSNKEETILTSNVEEVMLDFKVGNVVFENITIEAMSPQCAIIVRRGQLTLKNCRLIGDGKSSTHQGIIVLNGGSLKIVNCEICHFFTAIVGNSGSCITVENSEIHDCNYGLKIYDNCLVKAKKATIRNCKDYGVCLETENNINGEQQKVGDFDTLNIIPDLQMEFINGNNNAKGDAVINQKSKLKPVEDLFENPDSDPTVIIESDEEMDVHEVTVIENECDGRTSPATI